MPVAVLVEDLNCAPGAAARGGRSAASRRARRTGPTVGQLRDPGAVAVLAVAVDRLQPQGFVDLEDRGADGVIELVADREPDPGLAAVAVNACVARRYRRGQGSRGQDPRPAAAQREPEHGEVIGGRVRAGVPRSEDRGERLAGLVQIAVQRMEPVPVLVVPAASSFSECAVNNVASMSNVIVSGERPRPTPAPAPPPGPRESGRAAARRSTSSPDASWSPTPARRTAAPDPVRVDIGHTIAAVSEHHRHIPQHPARIMRRAALTRPSQRLRQRGGQPNPIGQLDQQRRAGVRHQPLTVRRHFYRSETSRRLHRLGVLPGRASSLQQSQFSRPGRTFPRRRQAVIGGSRLKGGTIAATWTEGPRKRMLPAGPRSRAGRPPAGGSSRRGAGGTVGGAVSRMKRLERRDHRHHRRGLLGRRDRELWAAVDGGPEGIVGFGEERNRN